MMSKTAENRAEAKQLARQIKQLPEFANVTHNQRLFLMAFIACGSVFGASRNAGLSPAVHYQWSWRDPGYVKAYEKAIDMYADYCEGDVMHRAFHGEEHTVMKNGDIIEKFTKKSDILAMFALKKMRPAYRDNPQLAVNVNNAPPQITFNVLSIEQPTTTNSNTADNQLIDLKQITQTANDNK